MWTTSRKRPNVPCLNSFGEIPKVPVVNIEEPSVHVNEESVAPANLVRFPGQEVLVRFRVPRDTPEPGHVEPEAMLAGPGDVDIF